MGNKEQRPEPFSGEQRRAVLNLRLTGYARSKKPDRVFKQDWIRFGQSSCKFCPSSPNTFCGLFSVATWTHAKGFSQRSIRPRRFIAAVLEKQNPSMLHASPGDAARSSVCPFEAIKQLLDKVQTPSHVMTRHYAGRVHESSSPVAGGRWGAVGWAGLPPGQCALQLQREEDPPVLLQMAS